MAPCSGVYIAAWELRVGILRGRGGNHRRPQVNTKARGGAKARVEQTGQFPYACARPIRNTDIPDQAPRRCRAHREWRCKGGRLDYGLLLKWRHYPMFGNGQH